jgi:sphinganine-1-phosphate aldolase
MHVDACVGGLELPFIKSLGYPVPNFDFQVPGVCSLSADIHKYGFTPKGASAILYRNPELRKYQLFAYADWPGGLYGTPNVSGSRPGSPIAASWALLKYLGREGYRNLAARSMKATQGFIKGIESIPELYVLGKPPCTVLAMASDVLNILALGEKMQEYGWYLDGQQLPPSLHLTISPVHEAVVEPFLADLRRVVSETPRFNPEEAAADEAAMYGKDGAFSEQAVTGEFIVQYLNELYRVY